MFIIAPHMAVEPEEIHAVMRELASSSDRSVGIVGGSLVETILESRLKSYLIQDKSVVTEMFRVSGPLGTFASKIRLGKLVGLYGDAVYGELIIIKDVRNKFAHYLKVRDFNNQQIVDWCQNFKFCDRYTIDLSTEDHSAIPKGTHPKDFPYWFGVADRDETLKTPRGRFITSISAALYALSISNRRVPAPEI